MAKRSTVDSFTTNWNKIASWAQASGIPSTAYLPIYQMDVQRLQAPGSYVLSQAQRHVAVLAAQNPNNVPSAPTDNPQPSNVFGNARHDLGLIVTGLEPTHLVSGLFDTVKNTVDAIAAPKREEGKDMGITAANWLQNTLLSFVPGAYDIGTVLRADPTLSGDQGFKALADHPLMSLLDVLPADAGGVLSKIGAGEALSRAAGITGDQVAEQSVTRTMTQALMNRTWGMKEGFAPDSATYRQLTIGDQIQKWLGNGPLGTSKPIQNLVRAYMTANQLTAGIQQVMVMPTLETLEDLSPTERDQFDKIMLQQQRGGNVETLMNAPDVSERTRAAVRDLFNGPIRFLTDHAVAQNDVFAVRRPDGTVGLYARTGARAKVVEAARDNLQGTRDHFLKQLDPLDKQVTWVNSLDAKQDAFAASLESARTRASQAVGTDEDRLKNVTREYQPPGETRRGQPKKTKQLVYGKQKEVADRVFGPSGLVSELVKAMKAKNYDQMGPLVDALDHSLTDWGYSSVDAASAAADPTFKAVADQVGAIKQLVDARKKANASIDRRIMGEAKVRESEKKADTAARQAEVKDQHDRHVKERSDLKYKKRAAIAQIRSARDARLGTLDDLYEKMKAGATAKAENAAARATDVQSVAVADQLRAELNRLRESWQASRKMEVKRYGKQELEAKLKFSQEEPRLKAAQDQEKKDLAEYHKGRKLLHGSMVGEIRTYTDAIKAFDKAVWDNPSDEYQSMELRLWQKHLMESEKNAELLDATNKRLLDKVYGGDQSRLDALHENTDLMKEQLYMTTKEIIDHPSTWEPQLVDFAKQAMEDARKSGTDELNLLIAEGYHPKWLPRAGSTDTIRTSASFAVGKGEPHVDVAHERVRDMAPTRHDVSIGVTKAMAQALQRDSYVDFVNTQLMPIAITGTDLRAKLEGIPGFEHLDTQIGNAPDALTALALKHGLKKFDSEGLFGFTPPTWSGQAVYLPEGLTNALEKTVEMKKGGDRGLFDKPTQLFRYSILGLSPRYTAHIVFGGTFLLALRSTPYLFSALPKAIKAMRDGQLDPAMFRAPAEEGLGRFQSALKEHGIASGKNMAHLAVQEHIEKTQGILLSKASPFHYLKAMADLNFKFTRYVTRLQEAVAYFDYSSKAERSTDFIDHDGNRVPMTKERAHEEGMNHVLQVFGDLRSMSPLERQIAKNILPFYGWTRHILKYVLTMPMDHPWRAMVLSLIAFENSEAVPKGLPERLQFLFFLGAPDASGNATAVDTRFLDPLRDVGNYATLGGWIQGLNPVLLAPLAMLDPQLVYGSTQLYPNLTYNDFYGIETAGAQGNAVSGLEQFVPQLGAVQPITQALTKAASVRELATNPNSFWKSIFNDLNVPFAQVQKVNVKQIAATDAIARYEVAKSVASNAFSSGDFSSLAGYKTVPYPLNPDYEVTPAQLQAIYNQAAAEYPGQQPQNVLLPPPTPAGF